MRRGVGVALDVGHRLLGDAEQLSLDWDWRTVGRVVFEDHVDARPLVDSHEPPRMSNSPLTDVAPTCSPRASTPTTTATSGFT